MEKHHWLVHNYLRRHFNMILNRGEVYKTQSMMYDDRYIVILKFTGSRFNYSLIDFNKETIISSCQPWDIFLQNLKRLAEG